MYARRSSVLRVLASFIVPAAAWFAAGNVAPGPAVAAPPATIPLDYRAYDGWRTIRGTVVSDDGRYVAYALVPQDGDSTLIVHDCTTGKDLSEARGMDPAFTADARFVVFTLRAPNAEIHEAQRAHKKPDEMPKNGLGILDVGTGAFVAVDRVKDFRIPKDPGSDTLAYALEPPAPSASPSAPAASATRASVASASPGASASPAVSASPDDLHKLDAGTKLVIRDLAAGADTTIPAVTDYALAHDGALVAYAASAKEGPTPLRVWKVDGSPALELASRRGHYTKLAFAPKSERLAFLTDAPSYSASAPQYVVYECDLGGPSPAASPRVLVDLGTPHFNDAPPSEHQSLHYTKDGTRLFFGVAAAPTPVPSGTPDPVKVDIWNYRDLDLQSTQRKHADDERKRTFAAIVSTDGTHALRLANGAMRVVAANENPDVALGIDDERYRRERSWDAAYDDVYAISLHDGNRRLIATKVRDDGDASSTSDFENRALSPRGRFFVAYDPTHRAWFSVDTADGKRTDLTSRLKPAFYDELDDHPAAPPPYGLAGWIDGDRFVMLRDRYDVWAVDPRTGVARDLTGGIGRKRHVIFEPQSLDPDAESFDSAKPIVLHARNEDTGDQGIWRVSASGAGAFEPRPVVMLAKAVTIAAKARAADRIVAFEQTFSEMRNLWTAPNLAAPLVKISDANPQRANYRWGDERLVSYRSRWGVALHGILYTPDGFDPHRKYPMLVYFYERFSSLYHAMAFTVPAPNTSPTLVRYVSNGYVVFVPDVAYRIGHPGRSALDCIEPGIDSIVKRGFVDPARIGIAGHSWAAYQIAYMLTRTHRFRAAEAGAAVANMTSAYGGIRLESGNVRESQYERGQSRIGATPWDRTDLYIENSALFHIRNVTTPYLTIANELDGAVPQLQGIEFFTALRRLGKEAYLFSFDGEDHNLKGREQQKYWTVHLDEFFDHYLLGKPEPAWMTHGVDFLHRGERDVDRDLYGESF